MGAVNVHDNSTWAENTRIFVLCHEPSKTFYETDFGADCLFSSIPLVAYVYAWSYCLFWIELTFPSDSLTLGNTM